MALASGEKAPVYYAAAYSRRRGEGLSTASPTTRKNTRACRPHGAWRRGRRCRHIGVGPFDMAHFALALGARAEAICTTDAAFADIAGSDGVFGHIRIQLTGDPLIDLLAGRGG